VKIVYATEKDFEEGLFRCGNYISAIERECQFLRELNLILREVNNDKKVAEISEKVDELKKKKDKLDKMITASTVLKRP